MIQHSFTDLEEAKAKVKEIVGSGVPLADDSLYLIQSIRNGEVTYSVEDGIPFLRTHAGCNEKVLWQL